MRLGVFGGTFNPVHTGHLLAAERLRQDLSLDRILFIPARIPVHKDLEGDASPADRLRMVELAVEGNTSFQALSLELERPEESYTVITLRALKGMYPGAELFLMLGTDSYLSFDRWKEYRNILDMAALVVMKRTDDVCRADWHHEGAGRVIFAANPVVEISSSDIRAMVRNGRSVRYLVPEAVERYIRERGLYLS